MQTGRKISPWFWIPTLYFAEGIPYYMVNNISVIMFNKMGLPNGLMALYTSMLYLPWVIKPLWSPFVDIIRSKRWWVTAMQSIMAVCFIIMAATLPGYAPIETITPFTLTLILFWIVAFASATHDIAADGFYMLGLSEGDQSLFVGIRSTFYRLASIFGQGVLVVVAGILESRTGDIPRAWKITLAAVAVIYSALALWHIFRLPKPQADKPREGHGAGFVFRDFLRSFATFFRKPQIVAMLLFLLLYRLPQAFLYKMMNPFLLDPVSEGGLGMSTGQVGIAYGTIGVAALIVSGILGGMAVAKWGLRKCLWPMAMSVALPSLAFIWMSVAQPQNFYLIAFFVAFDQIGYGFGFTAYMLYMIYVSQGEFKTSHYSLCTAFMALSMMLPGMVAGYIQESIGYRGFFIMAGSCCAVTAIVTLLVKIGPEYGKKYETQTN